MLRCIATFGFMALYLTLGLPWLGIQYLKEKSKGSAYRKKKVRSSVEFLFNICQVLCGAKVTYKGRENIPDSVPVVYAPNHKGYFDIILSYNGFKGPTGYVAKKELKFLSLGCWMKMIDCIFFDRQDPKSAINMIKEAGENLKNDTSVCIFPEGTRIRDRSRIEEFPNGSFKMAMRTGTPIIPTSITGTYDLWEAHFPKIIPQEVIIEFGEPIYPSELSKDDQKRIGEIVREKILEMYNRNNTIQ